MPDVVRPVHPFGRREVPDELVGVRVLQRLPDVPERLPLHSRHVRQALPERGAAVTRLGDEGVERVVERQLSLVAQPHHEHRGEGLGVRRDQELVVRPGRKVGPLQ